MTKFVAILALTLVTLTAGTAMADASKKQAPKLTCVHLKGLTICTIN